MSRVKKTACQMQKRRIWTFFTLFVLAFGILIYRMVDIQIINNEKYSKRVENQSTEKIELNSGRGHILDRNGDKLTDTTKQKILVIEKEKLNNNYSLIDLIKKATGIQEMDIYKAIQDQKDKNIIQLSIERVDSSYKKQLEEKGILVEDQILRYSPKNLLTHTIGYISKKDKVGSMGIEKSMDKILKNSNEKYLSVFKAGANSSELKMLKGGIKSVTKGKDDRHIKLTIDSKIQRLVENTTDKEENPNAVVISDVSTGEILAMSSRPKFDPNDVSKSLNGTDGEFENRAIGVTYPPGSVFKIAVLFSALENGVVDENYRYTCTGSTPIGTGKSVLRCHNRQGDGEQTLEQAFANSCNPAFYDIAKKLGEEKIMATVEKLHLFEKVDIGLDEEKSKEKPKKIALNNLAIGQENIEFTPLQINQMTQIIANNGTYEPLRLLSSIVDDSGKVVKTFEPTKNEEVISPYISNRVKEIMKGVSLDGTAKSLKDLPGGSGVKTGTAQSTKNGVAVEHGWITGYYPANRPKYVITVIVEGSEKGNKSAVPVFKEICEGIDK
ncbi:MAG: penicillin-binding protein 2 [Clostridioides sp.]|nr:penicillin-binding protein 2 [Clostridioides sp.]